MRSAPSIILSILLSASAAALLGGCAAKVRTAPSAPLAFSAESSSAIVLNLSGTASATGSPDWTPLLAEWVKAMTESSDAANVRSSVQEGAARPTGEPGTLVSVYVNRFRYVAPGSRYAGGVITGNAHLDVTVRFLDLRTGQQLGERAYKVSSSAMEGIFSAMTDKQVRAMAKDIVAEISRR